MRVRRMRLFSDSRLCQGLTGRIQNGSWGYDSAGCCLFALELSLRLVNSVLKNWGCDCVFFFNYNRVNMGLANEAVREHIDALFGVDRAADVREALDGLTPAEREVFIVEELSWALKEMGGEYVLPFTFKNADGSRTTHHLIFVSKNFKGYEIMKDIMASESSEQTQSVPSFQYSPASEKFPLLFELTRPLDDLEEMLLRDFAGRELTMREIHMSHSIGRPYVKANYKRALANLEVSGKVRVQPTARERPRRKSEVTFADHVKVSFPMAGSGI